MPYTYASFADLKAALLQRLQDTYSSYTSSAGWGFVSPAEAGLYIIEALRTLNAQAAIWNADYVLDFTSADTWLSLNVTGSPRVRTVTDTDLYTLMEYHLLEPPSGGVWAGSTQFNITSMSQALQYRRDELLQATGANMVRFTQASPTSTNRTFLADNILEVRRVRWIQAAPGTEAYALFCEDAPAFDAYGDQDILDVDDPDSFAVTSNPPLSFDCNTIPPIPGQWDILALESGASLAPPAGTVLELPNDWCWVAKWGALADLLANSPEGYDKERAAYCVKRFEKGKKAMMALPWLVRASVARQPADTVSFEEADAYAQNWEQNWNPSDPQIVVGGMDLVALAPFVTGLTVSSLLTVVGNAPIPASDAAKVQLSRDAVEAVLAYAQHLAMFKCGGAEFAATTPLLDQFERFCASENSRYAALGITRSLMIHSGTRTLDIDPRYEAEAASA